MARIKNWKLFQHYKDRKPPWIKLHRPLLDDREYAKLDPKAAKYLPLLWLLASEGENGELPDIETIAWRLHISEEDTRSLLSACSAWIDDNDSKPLSRRKRNDSKPLSLARSRETEREKEGETETEKKKHPPTPQPRKRGAAALSFQAYGEFSHVRLTPEQYAGLVGLHGQAKADAGIAKLDEWIEQKGKDPYKNHALTLKPTGWPWKRLEEEGWEPPAPKVRNIPAEFDAWVERKYPDLKVRIARGGFKALKAEFDAECGVPS